MVSKLCPTCRVNIALRGISHGCPTKPILEGVEPKDGPLTNLKAVAEPAPRKVRKPVQTPDVVKARVTIAREAEKKVVPKKRRGSPLVRLPQGFLDTVDAYAERREITRADVYKLLAQKLAEMA